MMASSPDTRWKRSPSACQTPSPRQSVCSPDMDPNSCQMSSQRPASRSKCVAATSTERHPSSGDNASSPLLLPTMKEMSHSGSSVALSLHMTTSGSAVISGQSPGSPVRKSIRRKPHSLVNTHGKTLKGDRSPSPDGLNPCKRYAWGGHRLQVVSGLKKHPYSLEKSASTSALMRVAGHTLSLAEVGVPAQSEFGDEHSNPVQKPRSRRTTAPPELSSDAHVAMTSFMDVRETPMWPSCGKRLAPLTAMSFRSLDADKMQCP